MSELKMISWPGKWDELSMGWAEDGLRMGWGLELKVDRLRMGWAEDGLSDGVG